MQAIRFAIAEEKSEGFNFSMAKDENDMPMNVERLYLIITINHFLESAKDLEASLKAKGDLRIQNDYNDWVKKTAKKIRYLRNTNEHNIDYIIGKGHNQDKFEVSIDHLNIRTDQQSTIHVGENLYVGDVELLPLLQELKEKQNTFMPLLEEIFYDYWIK
ncbi:MAG: hypothetical protein Q4B26_16160 [Eubacteriales bacterium]|nr:hypothetical protein [Eubacteriales bacterium]